MYRYLLLFLPLVVIVNTDYVRSQPSEHFSAKIDIKGTQVQRISYPRINIHLGAGLANGGRIGINVRIIEKISAELAVGNDLRNFISLSDIENRYSIGTNYHLKNLSVHVNFT